MKRLIILTLAIGAFLPNALAQDDLYFVPTKANVAKSAAVYGMPDNTYYTGSSRTTDDYNRRGSMVLPTDSAGSDVITFDDVEGAYPDSTIEAQADYQYTRRMNRFDDYDWYEPYWTGYMDGRFGTWGWYGSWYWDYPYYGYSSWYWGYPYHYYGSWYWDRPWYGGGWYGHYRPYYGGYAHVRPNGVRHFSSRDFGGARTNNTSTAARRNFGNTSRTYNNSTARTYSNTSRTYSNTSRTYSNTSRGNSSQRSTTYNGNFGGQRNSSSYTNTQTSRQSSSFSGSSSFNSSHSGSSFSGSRGGSGGGGSRGGSFGGRR